ESTQTVTRGHGDAENEGSSTPVTAERGSRRVVSRQHLGGRPFTASPSAHPLTPAPATRFVCRSTAGARGLIRGRIESCQIKTSNRYQTHGISRSQKGKRAVTRNGT